MIKVIVITGASSGIGLASLEKLILDGHIVYGSARDKKDLDHIKDLGGHPIEIEMSDDKSLSNAVQRVIKEQGRIDVLFNNAGYGLFGPVEETSIDDAKKQFDVNLFGLARLTQLVLPHMREHKSGLILNTSSMGGRAYTPLGAWYHATKYALEGWSDCLRLELKQFGIDVSILEPGAIKTSWGAISADNIERISKDGAYAKYSKKIATGLRSMYSGNLTEPSKVAIVVARAVNSKHPKTRYVVGKYARLLMFTRKYFSDRVYDTIISNA